MNLKLWSSPFKRRWLLWSILAVVYLLVSVYRLSSAVLSENLMTAFEVTATQLGTLHASFFYVYAPLQVVSGVLADRTGTRKSAAAGALVMNLGAVLFALSNSYVAAFAGRLLIGVGGSVLFVATLRFCANWYRADEFGTMNGITVAVSGLGGIVASVPLAVLVEFVGWRASIMGIGGVGLVFAGVVGAFLVLWFAPAA
ncbi:MAG: MFS transporter, partial [Halobacteria archaeon]|nr:MFS transporter [Halobacteria archaeon]